MEILPQQVGAEAVDGAEIRPGKQKLLPLQAAIFRVPGNQLGQLGGKPLLHFRGGSFGKGDHQQPVHVEGMVGIGDQTDDPLHQHGGFSAAGGGRHQHGAAPGLDALPLFRCP